MRPVKNNVTTVKSEVELACDICRWPIPADTFYNRTDNYLIVCTDCTSRFGLDEPEEQRGKAVKFDAAFEYQIVKATTNGLNQYGASGYFVVGVIPGWQGMNGSVFPPEVIMARGKEAK